MGDSSGGTMPIPSHLLEIIPKSGQYIKSIMGFAGYNDVEAVSRLKDPKELQTMFDFAADVADGVTNKEEIYGIFAANPKQLRILPGIEGAFQRFLNEVERMKPKTATAIVKPSSRKRPPKSTNVSVEDLESQVMDLLQEKRVDRCFRITNDQNDEFIFTCLHCHWKSVLVIHDDVACLRFVKNHITHHCIVSISVEVPESDASDASSKWNSRHFRNQVKLVKASTKPGQTKITEFFDINKLTSSIDDVVFLRKKVNESIGAEENLTVQPILKLLYANAMKNAKVTSKSGSRHENTVKMFAAYLFCLIGRAGYEFLLANVGLALPSLSTILRMINKIPRIREGQFLFDELEDHLNKWKAPKHIHVHMDDTRVLNKIEYDPVTDRFVGLVLPLKNGLPEQNAFILSTFDELKNVFETTPVSNYAHCIVAKPLTCEAPSFFLFCYWYRF